MYSVGVGIWLGVNILCERNEMRGPVYKYMSEE